MKHSLLFAAMLACAGAVSAKLPAPDEATKAKAAETAARAAWQAKIDAYQLCKAQDRVAARYKAKGGSSGGMVATAAPAAAGNAAATPSPAACAEPGPFAYNPPQQTPLESSGAHSPAGTAAQPPSVSKPAAEIAPARKP